MEEFKIKKRLINYWHDPKDIIEERLRSRSRSPRNLEKIDEPAKLLENQCEAMPSGQMPVLEQAAGQMPVLEHAAAGQMPVLEQAAGQMPVLEQAAAGQMPVLEQAAAGQMPVLEAKNIEPWRRNEVKDLQVEAAVREINDFCAKLRKYYYELDKATKEAYGKVLFNEIVPSYVKKFEEMAKENNGYFVGSFITNADLVFVGYAPFLNFMAEKDLFVSTPYLQKVTERVMEIPGVQEYADRNPILF